jgi:hypothetical protein
MKTNFIQKTVMLVIIALTLVMSSAFITKTKEQNKVTTMTFKNKKNAPAYYFVTAWKNNEKEAAVISNVVYVDCKFSTNAAHVEITFDEFYDVHYGNPGVDGSSILAFVYSSRDEAIRERQEVIDKFKNNKGTTTLVSNFSVPCN